MAPAGDFSSDQLIIKSGVVDPTFNDRFDIGVIKRYEHCALFSIPAQYSKVLM